MGKTAVEIRLIGTKAELDFLLRMFEGLLNADDSAVRVEFSEERRQSREAGRWRLYGEIKIDPEGLREDTEAVV